jgi:hypothetical protein
VCDGPHRHILGVDEGVVVPEDETGRLDRQDDGVGAVDGDHDDGQVREDTRWDDLTDLDIDLSLADIPAGVGYLASIGLHGELPHGINRAALSELLAPL